MKSRNPLNQNSSKKLTAISLFSGAMGLDIGLEKAGFDVLSCVENEKDCLETIKMNRPGVKVYGNDINNVDPLQILSDIGMKPDEVTLIAGGPPCQSFSTAGKRKSFNDFRGNVIVRFLDYVKAIKPKYFILENVRGIYSAKLANTPPEYGEYKTIEDIPGSVVFFLYQEFRKLGYEVTFDLFDSSLFSVPQSRERFVMFGSSDMQPIQLPEPTTPDRDVTLKQAIGNLNGMKHDFVKLREKHIRFLKMLEGGQYWKNLPKDLQEEAMGKSFKLGGGKTGFYRRLSWDRPSPTLVTHPAMPATMLVHPDEMRPLSIQEYALIQQFPPDWKFAGKITSIYKQIGNAVPVGLGYMAGKTIVDHIMKTSKVNKFGTKRSRYRNTSNYEFLSMFNKSLLTHSNQGTQFHLAGDSQE